MITGHLSYLGLQKRSRSELIRRRLVIGGWAFVVLLIAIGLWESARADTVTRYLLKLGIYSAAQGHTIRDASYRDLIQVPGFPSLQDCKTAGEWAVYSFKARGESDSLSVDILDYQCVVDHVNVDRD